MHKREPLLPLSYKLICTKALGNVSSQNDLVILHTSSLAVRHSSLTEASPQQTPTFTIPHYLTVTFATSAVFRSNVVQPEILCRYKHKDKSFFYMLEHVLITYIWLITWIDASHLLWCHCFQSNVWESQVVPTFHLEINNMTHGQMMLTSAACLQGVQEL